MEEMVKEMKEKWTLFDWTQYENLNTSTRPTKKSKNI